MLQYIRYELIKLRSRYFLILFTILLLVNALLCIYTVNADAGLPVDSMHEMMLLYRSDSEAITAEYEGLQSWNQEQNRLVLEQKIGRAHV